MAVEENMAAGIAESSHLDPRSRQRKGTMEMAEVFWNPQVHSQWHISNLLRPHFLIFLKQFHQLGIQTYEPMETILFQAATPRLRRWNFNETLKSWTRLVVNASSLGTSLQVKWMNLNSFTLGSGSPARRKEPGSSIGLVRPTSCFLVSETSLYSWLNFSSLSFLVKPDLYPSSFQCPLSVNVPKEPVRKPVLIIHLGNIH